MKSVTLKHILLSICGVIALSSMLSSCDNGPQPIPAEELYLRAFIKKYGLIDPKQDWNQAERHTVTVDVTYADAIDVYVKCRDNYYRVASYRDVDGPVEIPVDIPENTDKLYVDVDGHLYITKVGGSVNAKARSRAATGGEQINFFDYLNYQDFGSKTTQQLPMEDGTYVNCANIFYLPNPIVDGNQDPANAEHYSPCNNTSLQNMAKGTKVYAQLHNGNAALTQYMMTFTTSVTSATTIYLTIGNGYSENRLAVKLDLEGTETHTLLFSLRPDAYPRLGIYVAEGQVNSLSNINFSEFNSGDMTWLFVCEDLGSFDDFDFNDIIIKINAITTNTLEVSFQDFSVEEWQVVEDPDEHVVLKSKSRGDSRATVTNYTMLLLTPMAAGGVLDAYVHFVNPTGDDYVLGPGEWDLTDGSSVTGAEWHSWFIGGEGGYPNDRLIINTGRCSLRSRQAVIVVPDQFSMSDYSRIFRIYDGNNENANGSNVVNNPWVNTSGWEYGTEPGFQIYGFYLTIGDPDKGHADRLLGAPVAGAAPQAFLIPDAGWKGCWHWPAERVPITAAYPNFTGWVTGDNPSWYLDTPNKFANVGQTYTEAYVER